MTIPKVETDDLTDVSYRNDSPTKSGKQKEGKVVGHDRILEPNRHCKGESGFQIIVN